MNSSAPDSYPETRPTHNVLVGAPLVIVLAFAFGFVLLQPVHSAGTRLTSASQAASGKTSSAKAAAVNFVPAPIPQTSLPTLTPAPVSSDDSLGATADSVNTATPQGQSTGSPASSSATSPHSNTLQAAVPNSQSNTSNPISTKSSSPGSILTNFFSHF